MPTPNMPVHEAPPASADEDWTQHERTYRYFVRGVLLFAAHAIVILLILAWVFSDSFGTPSVTS
jgi:hypothetical protein